MSAHPALRIASADKDARVKTDVRVWPCTTKQVDERSHAIVAHAYLDLTSRCTGTSVSLDGQESSECLQDGPVAMYAKDGSKVGEITVCLDLHFKRQAQRTSFELNELLSQTDPTLQLYPSHGDSGSGSESWGVSFVSSACDTHASLQLSTVLEASREAGWSSATVVSADCTRSTPTHSTLKDATASSRRASPGSALKSPSAASPCAAGARARACGDESSSLVKSILEEGSEAAEKLVQMLADAGHMQFVEASTAASLLAPTTASLGALESVAEGALESVSEHGVAQGLPSDALQQASCSMCCDSSAIQGGGVSGAGSMVEVHADVGKHDKEARQALEDKQLVGGCRTVLDFSIEGSTSAHDDVLAAVEAGGSGGARLDARGTTHDGSGARDDMDVLTKLLQKGRQMLTKLDRMEHGAEERPVQAGLAVTASPRDPSWHAGAATLDDGEAGPGTQLLASAWPLRAGSHAHDSLLSSDLVDELGASLQLQVGDFVDVHAGVIDDLCRIGLEVEDGGSGSTGIADNSQAAQAKTQSSEKNHEVALAGGSADGASAGPADDFALSVHLAHVSIGGGRATALRAGDLIYIQAVLTVPATEGEATCSIQHQQLCVPVPRELPEGAAVSIEESLSIAMSPAQLTALRGAGMGSMGGALSAAAAKARARGGGGIGGLEVRVLHQPRVRVFGEDGYKNVGQMSVVGVGLVDLECVWAASRWSGIVHLRMCQGQQQGRKVATGRDKAGRNGAPKGAGSGRASSRYASLEAKAPAADAPVHAQTVVGRVELTASLVACPSKPVESAPCAEDARSEAEAPPCTARNSPEQNPLDGSRAAGEPVDVLVRRSASRTGVAAGDQHRGPEDGCERDVVPPTALALEPCSTKSAEDERGEQDGAWLLQLEDVVAISWKHTLSITCRMLWTDAGQAQPVLKACLGSRPGKRNGGPAADAICINVFQPRTAASSAPPRAALANASSKAVRSLFQGPGAAGDERHEAAAATGTAEDHLRPSPVLALELWELEARGKSKKRLVGLATLELSLQGLPVSGGEGSGAVGGCRLLACLRACVLACLRACLLDCLLVGWMGHCGDSDGLWAAAG